MSEKPLACPTCGREAVLDDKYDMHARRRWASRCSLDDETCWCGPWETSAAAAIAAWNRVVRAAQKDVAASGGDDGR